MLAGRSLSFTIFVTVAALMATVCCTACTPRYDGPEFLMAPRQNAPQPVYNRVMTARPPEVLPSRTVRFKGAPKVSPLIHLELKDETVENVAKKLASLAHYRSYTAAVVADRILSLDALGTVEELAEMIGVEAGVYVSVDKGNHEIRVLPQKKTKAKLYK